MILLDIHFFHIENVDTNINFNLKNLKIYKLNKKIEEINKNPKNR